MTKPPIDIIKAPEPKPEPPKGPGRPTDYRDEYAEQAYKLCLLGMTDVEMAKYFDVTERTLNNWKERIPEFFQSIKDGKENADMEVAAGLNKRARGFEYVEQQAIKVKEVQYENGKRVSEIEHVEIVPITKVMPADSKAASFWLKNRKADKWRDKHQLVDDEDNVIPQLVVIRPGDVPVHPETPPAPPMDAAAPTPPA